MLSYEEVAQRCQGQFKKHFNDYLSKTSFSHVLHHKAGEQAQVDWAICKALHIAQSVSIDLPGLCFKGIVTLYFPA